MQYSETPGVPSLVKTLRTLQYKTHSPPYALVSSSTSNNTSNNASNNGSNGSSSSSGTDTVTVNDKVYDNTKFGLAVTTGKL